MNYQKQIAERFVLHIWDGQRLKREMRSTAGETVRVEHPGQWNSDSGPDFKDARIRIAGKTTTGDVEIHTKAAYWTSHGHHKDPRYNRVILHAVMWQNRESFVTVREDGQAVPVVVLSDFVDESLDELFRRTGRKNRKCTRAEEIERIRPEIILRSIDTIARQRLEKKIQRFKGRLEKLVGEEGTPAAWDQLLYEGITEALGYSKNKKPFVELARRLPLKEIRERTKAQPPPSVPLTIQTMLFGVAGLLPSQSRTPTELDRSAVQYVGRLETEWQLMQPTLGRRKMTAEQWQFFRLRPSNFPTRRIAGLSFLLSAYAKTSLMKQLIRIADEDDKASFPAKAKAAFTTKTDNYWSKHYRFGGSARALGEDGMAIGSQRAEDIVVNIVLPVAILYARKAQLKKLESFFRDSYNQCGVLASNEATRFMLQRVFQKRKEISSKVRSAKRQQGLVHIYQQFCQTSECVHCPLLCGRDGK